MLASATEAKKKEKEIEAKPNFINGGLAFLFFSDTQLLRVINPDIFPHCRSFLPHQQPVGRFLTSGPTASLSCRTRLVRWTTEACCHPLEVARGFGGWGAGRVKGWKRKLGPRSRKLICFLSPSPNPSPSHSPTAAPDRQTTHWPYKRGFSCGPGRIAPG